MRGPEPHVPVRSFDLQGLSNWPFRPFGNAAHRFPFSTLSIPVCMFQPAGSEAREEQDLALRVGVNQTNESHTPLRVHSFWPCVHSVIISERPLVRYM